MSSHNLSLALLISVDIDKNHELIKLAITCTGIVLFILFIYIAQGIKLDGLQSTLCMFHFQRLTHQFIEFLFCPIMIGSMEIKLKVFDIVWWQNCVDIY